MEKPGEVGGGGGEVGGGREREVLKTQGIEFWHFYAMHWPHKFLVVLCFCLVFVRSSLLTHPCFTYVRRHCLDLCN